MTETDNENRGLQDAFGDRGTNINGITYSHPHGEKIINEAIEALSESETGAKLLTLLTQKKVPLHIMKGQGDSGFSPEMMTIIIHVSGKTTSLSADILINIIRALREAAQEIGGFVTPDPRKDVVHYAEFIHARNIDSITTVCKILKELTNSLLFPVLMKSLSKLGLKNMYDAYLEGASREELLGHYIDAYDTQIEGV